MSGRPMPSWFRPLVAREHQLVEAADAVWWLVMDAAITASLVEDGMHPSPVVRSPGSGMLPFELGEAS